MFKWHQHYNATIYQIPPPDDGAQQIVGMLARQWSKEHTSRYMNWPRVCSNARLMLWSDLFTQMHYLYDVVVVFSSFLEERRFHFIFRVSQQFFNHAQTRGKLFWIQYGGCGYTKICKRHFLRVVAMNRVLLPIQYQKCKIGSVLDQEEGSGCLWNKLVANKPYLLQ